MRHVGRSLGLVCVLMLALTGCASSPATAPESAIVTSHPLATQAALRTLDLGGNAFDAAITAATVLGVVEPFASGLGGGGLWLVQRPGQEPVLLDSREMAPATIAELPASGAEAAAIPGQPAALAYLSNQLAERPLRDNLAAAIQLARQGHAADTDYEALASQIMEGANPEFRRIFLADPAEAATRRQLIRQPELARTLEQLAEEGFASFYRGAVGRDLLADIQAGDGRWIETDLSAYAVEPRTALQSSRGEARILTAPPPSVSGLALVQMLGILENKSLAEVGTDPVDRIHHLVEVMRLAYRDARLHGADPRDHEPPLAQLQSPDHLQRKAEAIDPLSIGPNAGIELMSEAQSAATGTYLAVVDPEGNRVSASLSIGRPFGARFVSARTGVLLNDAMNDFSHTEDPAGAALANPANAPAPGKRPASTLAPVILDGPDRSVLLGEAGPDAAALLLTAVLNSLQGEDAAGITSARRFSLTPPGDLALERGRFTPQEIFGLEALGHRVRVLDPFGDMHAVIIEGGSNGDRNAAADPRGNGQAIVRPTH